MTFFARLRLRRGLFWKTSRPPMPWKQTLVVVACIAAYVGVAQVDRLAERAAIMERVVTAYEPFVQTLRDCERGATGYYYTGSTKAYLCPVSVGRSDVR